MRATCVDELADLFPDSEPPPRSRGKWQSDTARGGIACVHIMVHGLKPDRQLRVTVKKGLANADDVTLARLVDVPVEFNTGLKESCGTDNPDVIRKAPFRVFDAIEPLPAMETPPRGDVTVLRLERAVPRQAKVGDVTYAVTLTQGSDALTLTWTVRVHATRLPEVGKDSFPFSNWFNLLNMARYHGAEQWSERHWKLIELYAREMAKARQNTFMLRTVDILDKREDGAYTLNHKRMNRLVDIFEDAGLYYIEGPHLGARTGGVWASPTLSVLSKDGPTVNSPEGHARLADVCKQLMAAIERNGWRERWIQHCSDEPIAAHATDYRLLVGMTRKYMPGITIMDAVMDTGLAGSPDIWCPLAHQYEEHRELFDGMRAFGDRIWFYTCLHPRGKFLSRTMDMERLRPALIAWGAALYNLDGFLHWGLNWWAYGEDDPTAIDPFRETCKKHYPKESYLPPGDTHVVYPGPAGPWSSTRLSAHRVGIEDYEMIKMLKQKNPAEADRILSGVIRSFTDYTKDTREYRKARRALFAALED